MKKNTSIKLATRLSGYATMAASLLSLTNASGQIIYTSVDPDFLGDSFGSQFDVDFDNDGIVDAQINWGWAESMSAVPISENSILGYSSATFGYFAEALEAGYSIGEDASTFLNEGCWLLINFEYPGYTFYGDWSNASNKFLGVKFKIGTEDHYGWVRMDVVAGGTPDSFFIVKDFAYEAMADVSIPAGDSEIVGLLPTVIAQDITINLDIDGNATITTDDINNGSSDPEGEISLTLNKTEFTTADLGENFVFLRATDSDNNGVIGTAVVTVKKYLGLNTIEHLGINISPNPANDVITINNPQQIKISSLKLIDLQGRILLDKDGLDETISSLQLDTLDSGNYFLELTINNKTITEQIIKR